MLMGEYKHNIDSKGRLIIPAKLREELGELFVLTRGLDACIFAYPLASWEQIQSKLKDLPLVKRQARAFTRFFYSAAVEVSVDKQGRVNIPQVLLDHAQIDKACQIVGVMDRVEIWSAETWQAYQDDLDDSFEDIAEELFDLGL